MYVLARETLSNLISTQSGFLTKAMCAMRYINMYLYIYIAYAYRYGEKERE